MNTNNEHNDPLSARMGMWLFIFTEVLLFGILFLIYGVFLSQYGLDFKKGAVHLNVPTGLINTLILITSSFSIALAIGAMKRSNKIFTIKMLFTTIVLAILFLVIKAVEWADKFSHGIYPNSEVLLEMHKGKIVFFGLYFTMTGLHALHVFIGILLIFLAGILVKRDAINPQKMSFLVNVGLYWHLVDIIWIYLFPLFYLVWGWSVL